MFTFEFKWQRCLYRDRERTGLHWIGHGVNYSERGMLARSWCNRYFHLRVIQEKRKTVPRIVAILWRMVLTCPYENYGYVRFKMKWIELSGIETNRFNSNGIESSVLKNIWGNKMILCTSRHQVETSCFVSDLFCGFLFHIRILLGILSVYNFIPMYVRRSKGVCKKIIYQHLLHFRSECVLKCNISTANNCCYGKVFNFVDHKHYCLQCKLKI